MSKKEIPANEIPVDDFTTVFLEELEDIRKRRENIGFTLKNIEDEIDRIEQIRKKQNNIDNDVQTGKECPECEKNGDTDRTGFYSVLPGTQPELMGLALSGGGIRSATFNLGILQGLLSHDMLKKIDYLSTVSGGGYIGACMTALLNSPACDAALEKDNFPLGRSTVGDSDDPSIEKEPVRRLRYFSNYLMAEGGLIAKYVRPAMVFVRGVVLNFSFMIPYMVMTGLLLALFFNITFNNDLDYPDTTASGVKNNFIFFDYTEFNDALKESRINLSHANNELRKYAIEKTSNLNFKTDEERIEWIKKNISDKNLQTLLSKIKEAKIPLKKEWRQIWTLPLVFFALMILVSLCCRAGYSKPYAGRCRLNNISATLFFISVFLAVVQLYGVLIVYWKTWDITAWISSASVLALFGPRLLQGGGTGKKSVVTRTILAIVLLILVPLFMLFLTGVVISYASEGNLCILAGMIIGVLALSYINMRFINLNEISLHSYYRDCLSRAYMMQYDGKEEKLFPKDDLKLSELNPKKGPYHIFNTTLNLKKRMPKGENTGNLRNGESFIFTRKRIGSAKTAYVSTAGYERLDNHIDVGTAMAISGAAVNIGMAQKNLSIFRLLMGLMNIRLGYWALHPNEAIYGERHTITKAYPGSWQAFQECFGLYKENRRYINLSDGGHFDNLGVYELLRRRCKYIIVGDAEADSDMKFEALSYIMRLARIDFGIEIKIDISDIKRDPSTGFSRNHCVVGRIEYPEGDNGYLLYCKASLTGDEPVHLHEYRVKNPTFPHQTTADQWFDEQQFEAYRELGYHIAKDAFTPCTINYPTTEDQFIGLKEFWHPHSTAIETNFARHGAELNRIILEIKNDIDLTFMDSRIYMEWESMILNKKQPVSQAVASGCQWLPSDEKQLRKGFYLCNLMIQLMENVYMDLNLEKEYDHPDNRGWMNLFHQWSETGIFRVAWAICAGTFGARFQNFCERRLDLRLGDILIEKHDRDDSGDAVKNELNNYEREFIEKYFIEGNVYRFHRIFIFKLMVNNPGNEADFRSFHFGFSLVDSDNKLMFFRVQDHLRKMGLGRKSLKKLVNDNGITHYNFSVLKTHNLTDSNKRNTREFDKLFRQIGLSRDGEGI